MKWRQTKDFPKVTGIYLLDCLLNGIGRERFDINSNIDEISWKTRNAMWLDESESEPLYTEKDMEKFCQWMDEEGFCFRKQFNDWHCHIGGPHYTWEQLRALYLKTRIPTKI